MMTLLAPMTIESDAELSDEEGSDEEFGLEAYDDGEYRTVERAAPAAPAAPAPARRRVADESVVREMSGVSEDAAGRGRRADKVGEQRSAHDAADDAAIEAGVFDEVVTEAAGGGAINFDELGLCRCLLRAVAALGFSRPTAIQERVVPLALAGRDVCASAATGSGKTAAFGLPLLERVVRAKAAHGKPTIRGVILLPTRELAAQCEEMVRGLGQFSGADVALVVGGAKDVKVQELALRRKPDVVVATPGRLLDHLTNGRGVHLDDVECCVLDEADRLLELGFEDELRQLLGALPGGSERGKGGRGSGTRQTMLFSATFGAKVESLAALSLVRPVRVRVASGHGAGGVAAKLTQDFVRLKAAEGRAEDAEREATLLALLTRTVDPASQAVVFFDTKAATRRVGALLEALRARGGLSGHALPPATELHGGLRQAQRDANLARFERGDAGILLCTDVAARGLDLAGVGAVVNFEMPRTVATYVHRVGRTARAGRSTRRATRATPAPPPSSRARASGRARVPPAVLAGGARRRRRREADVAGLLALAAADRELSRAAEDAQRAENLLVHGADIAARPKREWFQSSKQKLDAKARAKAEVDALDKQRDLAEVRKRADDLPTRRERDPDVDAKPHRLSRLKRRRLEAKAAEEVFAEERKQALQDAAEARATKPKKPKKAKQARAAGFEAADFDDGAYARPAPAAPEPRRRAPSADGDDDDAPKKDGPPKTRELAGWTEFDPSKVSLRKKKAAKGSFKSKGRFKRR
ncbi:helicase [Aureococcus anophagefferens]|uniref:Helicase n=1 Tax=Aureococcus anophagefferens TaxID=44056 RepID=A0ABR1FTA5_AURAN